MRHVYLASSGSAYLGPRDVAERYGVTLRTVQRWIAAGLLPTRRIGGRHRIDPAWLRAIDSGDPVISVSQTAFIVRSPSTKAALSPTADTRQPMQPDPFGGGHEWRCVVCSEHDDETALVIRAGVVVHPACDGANRTEPSADAAREPGQ